MRPKQPVIYSAASDTVTEYFKKVWRYKHLVYMFAYQDIKVQYTQTFFSLLWVIIKPLSLLLIFTLIFDTMFHVPGIKSPYALFVLAGLLIWSNFSFMVSNAGGVVNANPALVRKMYFPRIILVLAKALVGLFELSVSLVLLFVLFLFYHQMPGDLVFVLPVFILLNLFLGLAVAVWLNALSIKHRDLYHFTPNALSFLIWLTPVFYPTTLLPPKLAFLAYLNPVAGIIQGCRWALLGEPAPDFYFLPVLVAVFFLLLTGVFFFIKKEDEMADYV